MQLLQQVEEEPVFGSYQRHQLRIVAASHRLFPVHQEQQLALVVLFSRHHYLELEFFGPQLPFFRSPP